MLIIRFVAVRTVDADPSRLVALRRSSCVFVDNSFSSLFQTSRAPAPHDVRIIRERNRGPGWRIGSTERFRFPSASRFVCLRG